MAFLARLPVRRRRWLVWLASLAAATILTGLTVHWLSAPANGRQVAVDQKPTSSPPKTPGPQGPGVNLTSAYFTLNLPTGYNLSAQSTATSGAIYTATILKSSADGSQIINLLLQDLPAGGLSGDSSFNLRQQQVGNYQLSKQQVKGETAIIFSRQDGTNGEVVAFWPHGSYLVTVSVTAGSVAGDTSSSQQTLNTVLNAWQWQ